MRSEPLNRVEPSLEERLAQLDQQLRTFETSLRTQQQSHVRARDLELELASVVLPRWQMQNSIGRPALSVRTPCVKSVAE